MYILHSVLEDGRDVGKAVYYVGRLAQLLGMWLLIVDIFTAGVGGTPNIPSNATTTTLLFGAVNAVASVISFAAILWTRTRNSLMGCRFYHSERITGNSYLIR